MVGSTKMEEFNRKFDEEFCLIACMEITTGRSISYIDGGGSSHLNRKKRFFQDLQEGETCICVELGDDERYQVQVVSIV